MEQRGDLLVFSYPGGEISFHKDLIDYYHIRNMICNCTPGLTKTIRDQEPQRCLEQLTQKLIRFIRKTILPSLHERKIYNVVEDDFVMGNPAYEEIFSSTQNFQRGEENAITQSAYEVQAKKDLAYNEAQSTVDGSWLFAIGMGFFSFPLAIVFPLALVEDIKERRKHKARIREIKEIQEQLENKK